MRVGIVILSIFISFQSIGQKANQHIQKGNDSYKKKQFDKAQAEYAKALKADNKNSIASFNSGNALHKMDKPDDAAKAYDMAASNTKDVNVKANALNNQGLALIKQKKLPEAIEAFKQSLRLYSFDKEVRENLQKALNELKKQQSSDQSQNKNQSQKDNKDKKNKSKMNEDQAERLLKQLQQDEKDTQKQLRKRNRKDRQLKDW